MILRKPYAFLIKNFKKIHLLLASLMIYIAYKCNLILSFFNEYINTINFTYTGQLANAYINIYSYVILIIIIIITISIVILMRQKNKPIVFYLTMIIFYIALIIIFFQFYNYLGIIEVSTINPQTVRVLRDLAFIAYLMQLILLVFIIMRGLGFNIKKFNFSADLAELEIETADSEEFELTVGVDAGDIGRGVRKRKREIRYFIIENYFVLTLLTVIIIIVGGTILFLNLYVYNRIYREGEVFKVDDFVVRVNASYLSNINYTGLKINNPDKSFLIVNIDVNNQNAKSRDFKLRELLLLINNKYYTPVTERYTSFVDLGVGYLDQKIKGGETRNFILLYEIKTADAKEEMLWQWPQTLYYKASNLDSKYRKVTLKAQGLDRKLLIDKVDLTAELSLKNSFLKESKLVISSITLEDSFDYMAKICIQKVCNDEPRILLVDLQRRNLNTILALNADLKLDETLTYQPVSNIKTLIANFGTLHYTLQDKKYIAPIRNITPSDNTGNLTYYEVSNKIKDASKIDLVLNLRNKEYIYNIK